MGPLTCYVASPTHAVYIDLLHFLRVGTRYIDPLVRQYFASSAHATLTCYIALLVRITPPQLPVMYHLTWCILVSRSVAGNASGPRIRPTRRATQDSHQ